MIYINILKAEIELGLKESISYKIGFFSDIIITGILYFSLIFLDSGSSLTNYYGGFEDSKMLLLIGYVFWHFSIGSISTVSSEINIEASKGTLEQKFMAIVPFSVLLAGKILSGLIIEIVEVTVIILLSIFIVDIGLTINLTIIIALFFTLIGMYGIGLIIGGVALKEKRIGNITFIIQLLLLFLTDVITKTKLPSIFSNIIPLNQGINLARKAVTGTNIANMEWIMLIITSGIWFVIGYCVFECFSRIARKNNLLGSY